MWPTATGGATRAIQHNKLQEEMRSIGLVLTVAGVVQAVVGKLVAPKVAENVKVLLSQIWMPPWGGMSPLMLGCVVTPAMLVLMVPHLLISLVPAPAKSKFMGALLLTGPPAADTRAVMVPGVGSPVKLAVNGHVTEPPGGMTVLLQDSWTVWQGPLQTSAVLVARDICVGDGLLIVTVLVTPRVELCRAWVAVTVYWTTVLVAGAATVMLVGDAVDVRVQV
jgi:hypothetical protein